MSTDFDKLKNREPIIPWEQKGPVKPEELPETAPSEHPTPWYCQARGNGHIDLFDSNGTYLVHIYYWGDDEWALLQEKLRSINGDPNFRL